MTVKVTGHARLRLVFFPGERSSSTGTFGSIYAIGGHGEQIEAAGGPPSRKYDQGGHTIEPTPAGHYVLGPRQHVVTKSWPWSTIPWGAALRINISNGEVEYESAVEKWSLATGPKGVVTLAQIRFLNADKKTRNPNPLWIADKIRAKFIDEKTNALRSTTYEQNDFGRWGWNLRWHGSRTPFYIHTTPADEATSKAGEICFLLNSHGCIHLDPVARDRFWKAGYFNAGTPFEVRRYSETGSP